MVETQRLSWPDYAKGMAIALIVVCHTGEGLREAGLRPWPGVWSHAAAVCYTFMVPVFFVLSGWFSERTRRTKGTQYQIKTVLQCLLYPYLVWSLVQAVLAMVTRAANVVPAWSELPGLLLSGYKQFWCLHSLMLSFAVDLILSAARLTPPGRAVFGAALALVFSIPLCSLAAPIDRAALHYIYFAVGCCLSERATSAFNPKELLLGAALGTVGLGILHLAGIRFPSPAWIVASFFGLSACFAVAMLLPESRWLWLLTWMGRWSLQIYCLGLICTAATRWLLVRSGLGDFTVHLLAGTFVGIVVPMAVAYLDSQYFGFLFRLRPPPETSRISFS